MIAGLNAFTIHYRRSLSSAARCIVRRWIVGCTWDRELPRSIKNSESGGFSWEKKEEKKRKYALRYGPQTATLYVDLGKLQGTLERSRRGVFEREFFGQDWTGLPDSSLSFFIGSRSRSPRKVTKHTQD